MYNYKKIAQQTYDPDSPDEPLDLSEVETVEMEPIEEQEGQNDLPEVTQEDVMSKMEDQTEEIEQQEPEVETEEPEGYPKFPNAFQAARWAKHNKQILRITYRTEKGHVIIRDVEPHGDFYAKTTHRRILVTYDRSIDDIRAFTVDRIQDFKFTGEEFTPRFNFSATRRNYLRRRKRKQRKILPFKRTSMENQIENIVKIASAAEDKGLLKQASALDSISKKMVMTKFAQYVGIQGYWIKNERCWSNCYRQKRATSKKAAQEVWVECQKEYADSINNPKSTWSKYANEVAPLTKFASSNHEKVAGKIIATEKEYFETKVAEKVASGSEYHTAVYNTIQERSDKYAESQIDLATEMLKVADSLYDNGMQKEASDLALEANELMKEAQAGLGSTMGNLWQGVKNVGSFLGGGKEGLGKQRIINILDDIRNFINKKMQSLAQVRNIANTPEGKAKYKEASIQAVNEFIDKLPKSVKQISNMAVKTKDPLIQSMASQAITILNKWKTAMDAKPSLNIFSSLSSELSTMMSGASGTPANSVGYGAKTPAGAGAGAGAGASGTGSTTDPAVASSAATTPPTTTFEGLIEEIKKLKDPAQIQQIQAALSSIPKMPENVSAPDQTPAKTEMNLPQGTTEQNTNIAGPSTGWDQNSAYNFPQGNANQNVSLPGDVPPSDKKTKKVKSYQEEKSGQPIAKTFFKLIK